MKKLFVLLTCAAAMLVLTSVAANYALNSQMLEDGVTVVITNEQVLNLELLNLNLEEVGFVKVEMLNVETTNVKSATGDVLYTNDTTTISVVTTNSSGAIMEITPTARNGVIDAATLTAYNNVDIEYTDDLAMYHLRRATNLSYITLIDLPLQNIGTDNFG
jgi:hypothetical protein